MLSPLDRRSSLAVAETPCQQHSGRPVVADSSANPLRARQSKARANVVKNSANFRFFVVDNPAKLKDREQMRANRKHVMNDYLEKERHNPSSTDSRVTRAASGGTKRKRSAPSAVGQSVNKSAATQIFSRETTANQLAFGSAYISRSSPESHDLVASSIEQNDSRLSQQEVQAARAIRFVEVESSPERSPDDEPRHSLSLTPPPSSYLGSNIQPFNTWPTLTDPLLDTERLKWSCSRNFRSRGIAIRWIPTILQSRHAFLSTICISASHDDVMQRGLQAPHERAPFGSLERMKVRGEIIGMVNAALDDPAARLADTTVVSVLHLLNSEIMGCTDFTMAMHARGLHDLVRQRGGLHRLGMNGSLASMTTITMYMIHALRESIPHTDFINYARQNRTRPPTDDSHLPESPLFCRPSGFYTIKRCLSMDSPAYKLIESLRLVTIAFVRNSGTSHLSPLQVVEDDKRWQQDALDVESLCKNIFAIPSANSRCDDFGTSSELFAFEALRLTAVLFAFALSNGIPLSKAAPMLSEMPGFQRQANPTACQILIKSTLVRTDLSDAWGNMAGVLLWITLIAGASSNPDSPYHPRSDENPSADGGRIGEEEEARKWLAAVAVRCSIILSFEYGGAMLETLKRLVGIEQILAKMDAERMGQAVPEVHVGGLKVKKSSVVPCGPEEPLWRNFNDYASDFRNGVS
ncbi:unnamed protein product [Zymoseptoria tritici ST99CH_1A5]|uniref:Tachykinin family protein n=3 Tax=Zymoseptoria tritici TaxID=1047171 RepID=A0A1X7RGM2_ZYMT9|nr:unnamed protein product [Zymoseptoria tritici ST99CH_3D7]SMR42919.1 unnamed protein product [Zymoseptoria tritici ST99CH_1E4]SMR45089.1 unnamed protein product [Zymoseptoria tritici ST99CH_3D1]SMY20253.1 unnamed protein product [Zymoseptoria tritici ST99CH_1A5]